MKSFSTDIFTYIDYTEMDDAMSRQVWECRNLPEIRKFMVNKEAIPFDSHCEFVKSLHDNHNALYYSVLLGGGAFVGSLNLHFNDSQSAERGIYLKPTFQGKGLSKQICRDIYTYFRDNCGLRFITTRVLKENICSNALEQSLGAEKIAEDKEFVYYQCNLSGI